jgi:hypothetical protein
MSAPSPLPWRLDDDGDIVDAEGALIYVIAENGNKPLIVRAVNSHADLLEALKQLHDNIAEYARINNLGGFDNQDMKMARAAIANAE